MIGRLDYEVLQAGPEPVLLLERFAQVRPLPGSIEVPLGFWEKIQTYLPWSWDKNHKTKWVWQHNGERQYIRFRRSVPFGVGTQTMREGEPYE